MPFENRPEKQGTIAGKQLFGLITALEAGRIYVNIHFLQYLGGDSSTRR
jgi:hypothetical protein